MKQLSKLLILPSIIISLTSCQSKNKQDEKNSLYSEPLSYQDSIFYINEGTRLAKQMYVEILTHLNKALDEQGPYEAVKYCNHKALPLTDSLSKHYGIKAKRTSLKLRNPLNVPDSLEKQVLQMYAQTLSKKPMIIKTNKGVHFFTPIYIAELCLTCHGVPNQDIPDVTLIALNELYPNDQAKNYELYDIRGIWSILFPLNYKPINNPTTNP